MSLVDCPLVGSPFHEDLHARLMLALAHAGQQAEALALFIGIRDRLHAELAVEPGPQRRAAHLTVLRRSAMNGRNSLPQDLPDFTGRDDERRELLEGTPWARSRRSTAWPAPARPPSPSMSHINSRRATRTASCSSISMPTRPARHHFPHGRRWRASYASSVESDRIPERVEDRATLWRSVTANLRLLVVLDNAADAAQLLNGPRSRDAVRPRVRPLHRRAGRRRHRSPAAVRVPTACRAHRGAKARTHPSWTVAHLSSRLGDEHRRLRELHVGDRDVRAAFAQSYLRLDEPRRRMFRLLGESPAGEVDAYAAAALAGVPHAEAQERLDDLLDARLLLEPTSG